MFEREEKMCREAGQKENFIKKCVLPGLGVPGPIYNPGCKFRGDGP